MLRVLHAVTDRGIGGAGILLSHLLTSESKGNIDYTVALPRDSALLPMLAGSGARLLPLDIGERSLDGRAIFPFLHALRCVRPTVLHTHGALSARIAAMLVQDPPYLVMSKHCVYGTRGSALLRFTAHAAVATAPCAHRALTLSGMPASRILTVPNAVPQKNADTCISCRELFVPRGRRAVVFCGRLEREKDPFFVLHLAKHLGSDPRFFFLVIGGGSLHARLAASARRLPNLRVVGHLPHENLPVRDAYLTLNCSPVSETACLSLLEGFSLGIPALASDIAGNRDLLAEGGGLLFHTGSVGDAAKKLCALAENDALYCRLQAQAAQIGSARTASHMCRAYERFYRALAREGAR